MISIDFNNKKFVLVENSEKGEVNSDTIFEYKQDGDLITAEYHGGTIRYGKIIAILKDKQLHMHYQCVTNSNELKAGKAMAAITLNPDNKIRLTLHWEWLDGSNEKGISEYIEC
ncbi:hypothetical protein GCM10022393_23580 [Aquimarina addita]|uniref:N-acetylglutamate synthase n=1 Tax=Aquimarina addita TaxID=870485 RepID=A0ABP6UMB5_9FLAO